MKKMVLMALAAILLAVPVQANLLVNGGFEDGLNGWSTLPGANSNYVAQGDVVFSGALALKTGPAGWAAAMQYFPTEPGMEYVVTFWCKGNNMYWGINSGEWWPERDPQDPLGTWHKNTYVFTAPTASTRIYFGSENAAGYWDEASVELVPEPASMAMLLTGLIGLGGVALRRRR